MTKALVKPIAVAVRDQAPITANSKLAVKHIVADAIDLIDVLKRGETEVSLAAASMVSSVVLFPLRHALCLQINVDVFNKKGRTCAPDCLSAEDNEHGVAVFK